MNSKKTSKIIVTKASKELKKVNTPKDEKSTAWSVLSQYKTEKETSKKIATVASKTLKNDNKWVIPKTIAWSALSQTKTIKKKK